MTHRLWVSHPALTCAVDTDELGVIVQAPPIIGAFLGQQMAALFQWLRSIGPGLAVEELGTFEDPDKETRK